MAATAHCLYCFESLVASLERRNGLSLKEVEESWVQYEAHKRGTGSPVGHLRSEEQEGNVNDSEMTEDDEDDVEEEEDEEDEEAGDNEIIPSALRPSGVSRLQVPSPASASTSSTPSIGSTTSSQVALGSDSKSSSKSSFFSFGRRSPATPVTKEEEHPLFVTWNTISSRGHKSLRGCIGTFEAQELSYGLKSYALTSAFDDTRFSPVTLSELPSLGNSITLLMAFTPCANPMDWDLETHGLRISFTYHGRRHSATYLPDVALEQGWTKEETIVSLMRKAGWAGRSNDWKKVGDLRCVKYQGKKASATYHIYKDWRDWVDKQGKPR